MIARLDCETILLDFFEVGTEDRGDICELLGLAHTVEESVFRGELLRQLQD